jgi:hypothetical protein
MYMRMEGMTHTTGAENRYCTLSRRSRSGEEGDEVAVVQVRDIPLH